MRTRGAVVTALVVLAVILVVGLSGCTSGDATTVATDPAPRDPGGSGRTPTTPAPPREPRVLPTAADRALAEAFTAFAIRPGEVTAAGVPWAGEVRVGLGESLFAGLGRGDLADRASWVLGLDAFGRDGPIDVLRPLRARPDGVRLTIDERPRCAGRGHRAPSRFREARRVTLQPARVESCLDWYAIDIYVDRAGQVRGVTLELWEP